MTFRYESLSLTQLGDIFGVSNQQIGKWLVELGLRTKAGKPSKEAFNREMVSQGPSRGQGYIWVWHAEQTVLALRSAGREVVPMPPALLVEPPDLIGPFSIKPCGDRVGIVNGDGDVCLVAVSENIARLVVDVLSLANSHGVIDRLAARHSLASMTQNIAPRAEQQDHY